MLEKYRYISITNSDRNSDIMEKVKMLFLSNIQQKRFEHVCTVAKQIDVIALQYGLDREKCRIAAMLHDMGTLIHLEDIMKYMESDGEMPCVHSDWAKAVNWIKKVLQQYDKI